VGIEVIAGPRTTRRTYRDEDTVDPQRIMAFRGHVQYSVAEHFMGRDFPCTEMHVLLARDFWKVYPRNRALQRLTMKRFDHRPYSNPNDEAAMP
jgi:hypothetical protein